MDIGHLNGLLTKMKVKLESLAVDEDIEMQQDDPSDSENDDARLSSAKARLNHLLAKLGANRSDSNRVRSYGTK